MLRILERVVVRKGMLVITGIRRGLACSRVSALSLAFGEQAGVGTKKRNNSVVVAQTLDHTQAEEQVTSLKSNAKRHVKGCQLYQ